MIVHLMFDGRERELVEALRPFPGLIDRIEVRKSEVSSVWVRDYGGVWAWSGTERVLVDGRYFVDCLREDVWPTRLAARQRYSTVRSPLPLDGGNLVTDGRGTCFTTTSLTERAGRRPEQVAPELKAWLGCQRTVFMEPLRGDEAQHIDEMLAMADPQTLLLAQADPETDPENHRRLERQARRLSQLTAVDGTPFRVLRVPLAPSITNPETGEPVLRSYLNLLAFNGVVLVPSFAGAGRTEARALAVLREAFVGRRVVSVPADAYAIDGGAIHCVTWTVPKPGTSAGQAATAGHSASAERGVLPQPR